MTFSRSWLMLVIILGLLFLIILGGASVYKEYAATKPVTISYKNSHDVSIYDTSETRGDGDKKLVTKISTPGESTRLRNDRSYVITYRGDAGYADGEKLLDLAMGGEEVVIDPYFTEARLNTLLQSELGQIQQVMRNAYPNINLYKIQPGKLYRQGDWYGTTLHYIGDDNFNDDTLRAVLHKENGVWVMKTTPPNISLSKFLYPDIPEDILRDLNKAP